MINVLIVDDEPFIRQGLQLLMDWESCGYQICGQASNGLQALECIRAVHPDLVIADIKMPEMDGMELARTLYEQYGGEIKLILLSGFYEFEYAKQAIKYQVNDYILKPIVKTELVQVLEEFRISFDARTEEKRHQQEKDRIIMAQHMQSILLGSADKESVANVQPSYQSANFLRCMLIEATGETAGRAECETDWCSRVEASVGEPFKGQVLKPFTGEKNAVLLILTDLMLKEEAIALEEYIGRLHGELNQGQESAVAFYIGKEVQRVEELYESYQSCGKMKSLRFFTTSGPMYYFEHMNTEIFTKQPGQREKQLFDGLIKSIEQQQMDELRSHAEAIFQFFLNERIEPGIVRIQLHYLAYNLLELVKGETGPPDSGLMQSAFLQMNYAMLSMEANIENLWEFSRLCAEKLKEQQKWNAMGVLARIEAFIHEHYRENISLKLLGEQFYMNSAYLGQIFKKHYAMSFNDYLNQLRVEEAARLLRRTDQRVYEIATAVGYRDSDYFINRFEKLMDETPAQYRKRAQAAYAADSTSCTP
ncbi:two-component system response regulator YesN [Paenibacillus pabuli]|uniref:Two-component system response regulator YesN n=1 Tax=Paenibacillus pabuli TaxID=1472 RepID=A0ABX9BEC8_9BACL|nr:response regulator [Paenibacillus pabuli]RAI88560.1 two-component system response regulator YesN [Paenibacillus pabuli]